MEAFNIEMDLRKVRTSNPEEIDGEWDLDMLKDRLKLQIEDSSYCIFLSVQLGTLYLGQSTKFLYTESYTPWLSSSSMLPVPPTFYDTIC